MKYSFIICSYKDYASLDKCLSLIHSRKEQDYEVIIHDNTPDPERQRERGYLGSGNGIGYASGCNNAVSHAQGEILVFLNPDTEPEGDWLDRMAIGLEEYDAIGSTSDYIAGFQKKELWEGYDKPFAETRLIIPVCMVIKTSTYRDIPFDNSFFLGCEDLDWSWRMVLVGKRMAIATDVFVHHVGHTGFNLTPGKDEIIKAGEARMREKLAEYYGENVPSSEEVWGCKILATELKPMRLSVCMIAPDDRKPEFPWADEVVCINVGTEINDFSEARNKALAQCTGDWVIWLDTDDIVSRETSLLIDALIHKPGNNVALQSCHFAFRVENVSHDGSIRDSFYQSRLFPRLPGIEWGGLGGCKGLVHETIYESCQRIGLPMVQVNNLVITHTGYSDQATEIKKAKRNLNLLLKEPDNAYKWYNVGCSYMAMGELEVAAEAFKTALDTSAGEDKNFVDNIRYNLGMSLHKMGDTVETVIPYMLDNQKPDSKWLLGMLKLEQDETEEGCDLLWAYLKMGDVKDNMGTNCPIFRKAAVNTLTEIGVLNVGQNQKGYSHYVVPNE